jgi:hypothetical protein
MDQISHSSPFDAIRHEDEHGKEYWSARELYKLLGYSSLQAFQNTIVKAREACAVSKEDVFYHFYPMPPLKAPELQTWGMKAVFLVWG